MSDYVVVKSRFLVYVSAELTYMQNTFSK